MSTQDKIQSFLSGKRFAVVGASTDRSKYGNKVLRVYLQNKRDVVPINPSAKEVEGLTAYPDLASVPGTIDGVSIITQPTVTENVVSDALARGINNIWIQPGAESEARRSNGGRCRRERDRWRPVHSSCPAIS